MEQNFINDPYGYGYETSVANLVKLAKKADKAYYNEDDPIFTDQQYDLLRDIIKERDPDNAYLKKTGASVEKVESQRKRRKEGEFVEADIWNSTLDISSESELRI